MIPGSFASSLPPFLLLPVISFKASASHSFSVCLPPALLSLYHETNETGFHCVAQAGLELTWDPSASACTTTLCFICFCGEASFELRASLLLSRFSTTWAMPPASLSLSEACCIQVFIPTILLHLHDQDLGGSKMLTPVVSYLILLNVSQRIALSSLKAFLLVSLLLAPLLSYWMVFCPWTTSLLILSLLGISFYLVVLKSYMMPGVVVHACNPCTQEAEARRPRVLGQHELHS
jgi:hypothetical protein